jgi:hypothetical protein
MVAVHDIPMDRVADNSSTGAVALQLLEPSRRDRVHSFRPDGWEVEVRRERSYVVARTVRPLDSDALLDAGIRIAHRALDLTSVENTDSLITRVPADNHIMLIHEAGRKTVRYQETMAWPMEVSGSMRVVRANGQIESQNISPPLSWTSAFRFYRLSQASRDLFEAFRNMYLGLEALLDELFPKQRGEREKNWLLWAVRAAGARVGLAELASRGASDAAGDIVDRLYTVRLHLFHAKTGRTLIPDERISYAAVAEAYPILLTLWTEIVREWLSLRRGGGAITYGGFQLMVERSCTSARIAVTPDATPPDKADQAVSPSGMPVFTFAAAPNLVELRPGRMALWGKTDVSALSFGQPICRVCALIQQNVPLIVGSIVGGLTLEGADAFETVQIMRLVNRGHNRSASSHDKVTPVVIGVRPCRLRHCGAEQIWASARHFTACGSGKVHDPSRISGRGR